MPLLRHHNSSGQGGLVRVRGHQLVLGNRPFYFAGANCYYLLTRSADASQRLMVLDVLDGAVQLGMTVLRCWAFCDGPDEWMAMQPAPGVFSEAVLSGLDWLVAECAKRGLLLLLALTNYHMDYGGMPQYVRWAYGIPSQREHELAKHPTELFYTNQRCQAMFREAVAHLLRRKNTLTGRLYREDPAILGWELANEPRCEGDALGVVLKAWVQSTAAWVRQWDRNHLLTVGLEGFYGPSTPELLRFNPYPAAAQHGTDFAAIASLPCLDFATVHLYVDQWCSLDASAAQLRSFAHGWLRSHALLCAGLPASSPAAATAAAAGAVTTPGEGGADGGGAQRHGPWATSPRGRGPAPSAHVPPSSPPPLRKPLVLAEFGKREPRTYHGAACSFNLGRLQAYQATLDDCLDLAAGGGPLAGVAVWMLASKRYVDYDGYTLHVGEVGWNALAAASAAAAAGAPGSGGVAARDDGTTPEPAGTAAGPERGYIAATVMVPRAATATFVEASTTSSSRASSMSGAAAQATTTANATTTTPDPTSHEAVLAVLKQYGAVMRRMCHETAASGGGAGMAGVGVDGDVQDEVEGPRPVRPSLAQRLAACCLRPAAAWTG